jgi:hypothetical protein
MQRVKGYHGEWNMGSPGGWEYQRMAQQLGNLAWDRIRENVEVGVDLSFEHPRINAVPGFGRMLLRAHTRRHGRNSVHAVLLAETETLDIVLENKNFVDYLNRMEGVRASLAGPADLTIVNDEIHCRGAAVTVMFIDFNMNTLPKIAAKEDVGPIMEAIKRGVVVNPRGMEPLGAKGVFEAITGDLGTEVSEETRTHTPWTRQFYARATTGPQGEPIEDLISWTEAHWADVVLKPAHGYSGHGIFVGYKEENPGLKIQAALDAGDYIVQELVPLPLWSEETTWPRPDEQSLFRKEWQTDFRCFITDEGLQGFLARFGGVPTNVGSGGGVQPIAVLQKDTNTRRAVDEVNQALQKLGYAAYSQIKEEIDQRALDVGFTYLDGPIMITLRPRILTMDQIAELEQYAHDLWQDALMLEDRWRRGGLEDLVQIGQQEKELALEQPWEGSPALMVSDGLFSFGADVIDQENPDGKG